MIKLKVLYVCHAADTLGGAALSLYNLILSVANEVEPTVLLSKEGIVSRFFESKRIKCIYFPFLGGIKSPSIPRRMGRAIYECLIYRNKVKKFARKISPMKFDLIHSNSSAVTVGYELAKLTNIKHVWHVREFLDLDFGFIPTYGWKKLKEAIAKSDASIYITQTVKDHFFIGQDNSWVIWDAVRSKLDIDLCATKQKYFVHTAANLGMGKGTDKAVLAFVESDLWKFGYQLYLAGNINESFKEELIGYLPQECPSDSLHFLGYVTDIKELLVNATSFLMCSNNEGLGRVTIEAMFYGCPVIGFRSAGTAEILKDGIGILVNSFQDCAAAMRKVVDGNSTDAILKAQKFAQDHFSIEGYGKEIMKVYNSILQ